MTTTGPEHPHDHDPAARVYTTIATPGAQINLSDYTTRRGRVRRPRVRLQVSTTDDRHTATATLDRLQAGALCRALLNWLSGNAPRPVCQDAEDETGLLATPMATRYTLHALPEGLPERHKWALHVSWHRDGPHHTPWSITDHAGMCLGRDGEWTDNRCPVPDLYNGCTDADARAWLIDHRYTLNEAISLARRELARYTVGEYTAVSWQETLAARRPAQARGSNGGE